MKEELITFETAKLAKELGWNGDKCGCFKEECQFDKIKTTQSLLQRWLREKHKLIVTVGYVYEHDSTPYTYFIYNEGHSSPINAWEHDYSIYEEALEKGLKTALNEIQQR